MSIRLRLTLLLGLLFFSSIGNIVFTFILESYGEKKLAWVIHTHEVISVSDKLLSTMTDTETGQRGFLLTKDTNYLEPYYSGVTKARAYLDELLEMTSDNPLQQERLLKIEESMILKIKELKLTIDLMQSGESDKSLDIVLKNTGKKYMDDIREELVSFNHAERLLLEKRDGDFRESRAQITTLVIFEFSVFIFLAVITFMFVKGSLFNPLKLLLASTAKMERGEVQDVSALLPNDEMGYLLSRFYKMSEKVLEKNASLTYSATHDVLTGLKNRVNIHKEINDSISYLEKSKSKMALLFIDLNAFKVLNDTFGHDAGDLVLKETSIRLEESVRSGDSVFRYGGDEFIILIKDIHNVSQIEKIACEILKRFNVPVLFRGHSIDISLSMGIAISPDDSTNSDNMIKYSDIAMYDAKRDKKANHKFFSKTMVKRWNDSVE
ncbi:MAG: diguanylate cyclase [Campylobacteraceae bacterium]|nr:diguanylate cyclase [Campylobacteraceae bacterium]